MRGRWAEGIKHIIFPTLVPAPLALRCAPRNICQHLGVLFWRRKINSGVRIGGENWISGNIGAAACTARRRAITAHLCSTGRKKRLRSRGGLSSTARKRFSHGFAQARTPAVHLRALWSMERSGTRNRNQRHACLDQAAVSDGSRGKLRMNWLRSGGAAAQRHQNDAACGREKRRSAADSQNRFIKCDSGDIWRGVAARGCGGGSTRKGWRKPHSGAKRQRWHELPWRLLYSGVTLARLPFQRRARRPCRGAGKSPVISHEHGDDA